MVSLPKLIILTLTFIVIIVTVYWNQVLQISSQIATAAKTDCADTNSNNEYFFFNNTHVLQNDTRILNYLLKYHISPPSKKPYRLLSNKAGTQVPQIIDKLFNGKNSRFFIEAGAADGEYFSNTLPLERKNNWTGLLIEPNSFLLPKLRETNRKAWISDACLSLNGVPTKELFYHRLVYNQSIDWPLGNGKLENRGLTNDYVFAGSVECFTLYSMLKAINVSVIDFFSLDIEGNELNVLKTIPFDLVTIKIFIIEHELVPGGFSKVGELLEANNYLVLAKDFTNSWAVRKDYYPEYKEGIWDAFRVNFTT